MAESQKSKKERIVFMKKNLAIILAITILMSMMLNVSASDIRTWNFDNGAFPSDWTLTLTEENTASYPDNAAGKALMLSHSGAGTTKIVSNEGLDYGNGDYAKFSYDIKIENADAGNIWGTSIRFFTGSANKWVSTPAVSVGGEEGTAICEAGKWYKMEYFCDLKAGTIDVYQTDDKGVKTKIGNTVNSGVKNIMYVGRVEMSAAGKADISFDNFSFTPYNLTLDIPAEIVDGSDELIASGTLPEGTTKAKLLLDGKKVADLSVASEFFSQEIDTSALALGNHKVTLSATAGGEEKEITKVTTLTGQFTKDFLTGVPATGGSHWSGTAGPKNYSGATGESGYFQHIISGGAIVENKTPDFGVNTLKVTGGTGKYYELRVAPYPYVTKGIVKIAMTAKFETQPTNMTLESKTGTATDPAAGTWPFSTAMDSYIQSYFTNHTFSTDTDYTLAVTADLTAKKWSFIINDEILFTSDAVAGLTSLGELKFQFKTDCPTMYITDIVYENTLPLSIGGMSYYLDGVEKPEAEWENDAVSNFANAVSINLSDAPDAASITAQTAKIEKDGVAIGNVTPSISSTKVMFTLNEGTQFDAGETYKIVLSGVSFGGTTFAKNIEAEFVTAIQDAAIYPSDEMVIRQDMGGKLKAAIKERPESATFKIDGKDAGVATDANGDGIYELEYDWENTALGKHTFTVAGTEISADFEITKNIGSAIEIDYTQVAQDKNITFIATEGSDGTEGGAVNLSGGSQAVNGQLPADVAGVANTVVMSKFDIMRNGDYEIRFECKSPNSKWVNPGFGSVIAADGTVAGSNFKMETGEWYSVEVVSDFITKHSTVYVDGELVKTGYDASIANGNGLSSLKLISYTTDADYSFDNWYSGLYVENPKVSAAAYKIGEGEFAAASGNTVSSLSKEIKLTMTKAIDAITADQVLINGTKASAASVSGADIIIAPAEGAIKANEEIVITLDKSLASGTYTIGSDTEIRLMANGDTVDNIGDITLSALADGSATATVTVVKGTVSDFAENAGAMLVLCAYDGDNMTKIDIMRKTYAVGENAFTAEISGVATGKTVKAMLWSNGNISPIRFAETVIPE